MQSRDRKFSSPLSHGSTSLDSKSQFKTGSVEERAPSPVPLSPPDSPVRERREIRDGQKGTSSQTKLRVDSRASLLSENDGKKTTHDDEAPSSPINIPMSQAKKDMTPGLESKSLNSLTHVPASKYLVGRSHYSSQPITVEYYISERSVTTTEDGETQTVVKQSTTIRSIGEYQVIRTVGSGSTGKVKLGVNIRNQQKVAIKIISRKYISDPGKKSKETATSRKRRIMREASILNLIHHPNIVRLYDLYLTDEYYCMVFEYVDGGQMLDYIISHGKLKEAQARKFFLQLLSAVSYCHDNGIVHRDLKIENVLIDSEGGVKLVDFGLSNFYDPSEKLKTFCGSLYFAAPELLKGIIYTGPEIDIWSLGIILYVLVCGKVPFDDKSLTTLHEKIKAGQFVLPPHLSGECQNLLKIMIEVDPKRRVRMQEIFDHSWIKGSVVVGGGGSEDVGGGGIIKSYTLNREEITRIKPDIKEFIIREFPYQFEAEEIERVLKAAVFNSNSNSNSQSQLQKNPIIALYHLAAQKQERQLRDPFSLGTTTTTSNTTSSPRIPSAGHGEEKPLDSERKSRRRTESLPGTKMGATAAVVEVEAPQQYMKSKRSASLQDGAGGGGIVAVTESLKKQLFSIDEESMKVRTVYLRGIFSVNTTTTKNSTQVRNIIIKCLVERHPTIIFLDRESYFICEYQASVCVNVRRRHDLKELEVDDDNEEEITCEDDVDISQVNLTTTSRTTNDTITTTNPSNQNLTFGAVPLRSIRFEIHIVKVALLGLNGIQFKRISGDFGVYKNLCSQLISEFNL